MGWFMLWRVAVWDGDKRLLGGERSARLGGEVGWIWDGCGIPVSVQDHGHSRRQRGWDMMFRRGGEWRCELSIPPSSELSTGWDQGSFWTFARGWMQISSVTGASQTTAGRSLNRKQNGTGTVISQLGCSCPSPLQTLVDICQRQQRASVKHLQATEIDNPLGPLSNSISDL